MATKIQFRRGTATLWASTNPILSEGEIGVELDTRLLKIGNGVLAWNALPYVASTGDIVTAVFNNIGQSTIPPAVAGQMKMYAKAVAGRILPYFVGPAGVDSPIQPLLARNKVGYWCPPGNASTVPGVLGYTAHTRAGTVTTRNVDTTNMFTRMRRLGQKTATTAGSVASLRVPVAQVTLGNSATNLGGFFKVSRWGISDDVFISGCKGFVGVSADIAAPTNVEPSTLVNVIGVGYGSSDNNLFLYYGGTTAQTPINLGSNFPVNTTNVDVYELALFAPPSSSDVYYEVTRINTGHVAAGLISNTVPGVTLPSSNLLLSYMVAWRSNGTSTLAAGIDLMSDYIETDQ